MAAACLSACSGLGSQRDESDAGGSAEDLASLVRFGAYVQTLDESRLTQEYEQLLTQYRTSPSSDTAIKLSLLLSRSGARPAALEEALALLMDVRYGGGEGADFGRFIYHSISERYLAAASRNYLSAMLLEDHVRTTQLNEELAEARATIEAARRERATLVQQLDALKAIEEQIAFDEVAAERVVPR